MIGVVKIKDGLFICDEFGAQVSLSHLALSIFHQPDFRAFRLLFLRRLKLTLF